MSELSVRGVGSATGSAAIAVAVARMATLEDVIRHPALRLLDVVVQDEYTHDVIVAADDVFLVFDST